MLLGTACAAPAGATATQEEVTTGILNALDQLMPTVNFPRLEVVYDANGIPSIFGIKTTTLQSLLPVNLSFLNLQPAYIQWFSSRNLQHIEVELADDGLFLYANGAPLPYLAWDADSLNAVGTLLDSSGMVQSPIVGKALPLLQRIGLDVVVTFPSSGTPIAMHERGMRAPAVAMEPTGPQTGIQLGVAYTSDGLPSVLGMTSRDLLGLGINLTFLELQPPTVQMLNGMNLQSVQVATQPDGIVLSVNGMALPRIGYSAEHLQNAIGLYGQLYGESQITSIASNLVPLLEKADVDLQVALPAAAAD
jgi:hypothetical protein